MQNKRNAYFQLNIDEYIQICKITKRKLFSVYKKHNDIKM